MSIEFESFRSAIDQFNNGHFFEAHDTWEEIWRDTSGEERLFIQGLIQVSVGYFHAINGKYHAAISQLLKGIEKLSRFPSHFLGIDAVTLREAAAGHASLCEEIVGGRQADIEILPIPRITFVTENSPTHPI